MPQQEPDPNTQRDLGNVERWVILWGYVGEAVTRPAHDGGTDQTSQRLYVDLTKEHWLEVNVDNIHHRQDLEPGRGSLLWVPRDAWVAKVSLAKAADFNAASGFLSGGFWPQSPFPDDPYGSSERKTSIPYRCC